MTENANQGKGRRLQWFRFYSDVVNDPKVQRLSPQLFKTWVNLLCLAAERDGQLPSIDDMAFQLRLSVHEAQQQIDDLILAGLVDIQTDKSLTPHNWNLRQFKSDTSADRTRKYRENKKEKPCDVTVTSDVTRPEAETETETETETTPPTPSRGPSAIEVFEAYELWNVTAQTCGLAQAKLTPDRRKKIAARMREHDGLESWHAAMAAIERSSFLTGGQPGRNGGESFRASLDFVLQKSTFVKLIEGTYGNGRHNAEEAIETPMQRTARLAAEMGYQE